MINWNPIKLFIVICMVIFYYDSSTKTQVYEKVYNICPADVIHFSIF
jgi:hypothetical protein